MKILAIFAHPDDESYGPAGTLAKLCYQGHHVVLLTFTRGEAGSLSRDTYISAKKLAKQRDLELQKASNKIGIEQITHRINIEEFISAKIAAIQCHKTQNALRKELEKMKSNVQTFLKWEVFVQKWPEPVDRIIKFDLFQ